MTGRTRRSRFGCGNGRERQEVEGAARAGNAVLEDMGVDLGGGDVGVAEQVLDRADVGTGFEEMSGKAVAVMPSSA
jgi:hypothetical protein